MSWQSRTGMFNYLLGNVHEDVADQCTQWGSSLSWSALSGRPPFKGSICKVLRSIWYSLVCWTFSLDSIVLAMRRALGGETPIKNIIAKASVFAKRGNFPWIWQQSFAFAPYSDWIVSINWHAIENCWFCVVIFLYKCAFPFGKLRLLYSVCKCVWFHIKHFILD